MTKAKKLEMTEEEICKKYKGNPSEKHIKILAELNGVPIYRIKRILAAHGCIEEEKGGDKTQEIQEADKTLIDNNEKNGIKNDFCEVKLSIPALPEAIKRLVDLRIDEINQEVIILCDQIDRLSDERNELKAFLRGESNEENGIYGKVQAESK